MTGHNWGLVRLCADGALLDVSLLAAVAALASLRLPQVDVQEDGSVVAHCLAEGSADGPAESATLPAAAEPPRCSVHGPSLPGS